MKRWSFSFIVNVQIAAGKLFYEDQKAENVSTSNAQIAEANLMFAPHGLQSAFEKNKEVEIWEK